MSYYVFRIDYGKPYDNLKEEILQGRLRQGWGAVGMDVREGGAMEKFIDAWGEKEGKRRYNIINIMTEIRSDDIIIIPKLNIYRPLEDWNEYPDWGRFFTIVRCTGEYSFSPIKLNKWDSDYDRDTDYGHIINVKPIASFSRGHNYYSRIVGKFGGYWSAVNRVYNENFINAADKLMQEFEDNNDSPNFEDKSSMNALAAVENVALSKNKYLMEIVNAINNLP